jgi:hypothetical protein
MGKHKLFFRIFVLSSGLFINTSCEFIWVNGCEIEYREALELSEKDELPDRYCDYCNCYGKWKNDGYTDSKAKRECEFLLNE